MTLSLRSKGAAGAVAVSVHGAWQLDADLRWIVEGACADIDAVILAVGEGVATRVAATVVELAFGNAVGTYEAGPLGLLCVRKGTLTEQDFYALLARVAEASAALPFAATTAASTTFSADASASLLFHAFACLRSVLRPDAPVERALLPALERIVRHPHRRLRREGRVVEASQARRVDPPALVDVLCGRWPLVRVSAGAPLVRALHGHAPTHIEETIAEETVDTAENRFVKASVTACLGVVDRVFGAIGELPSRRSAARVERDLDWMGDALRRVVRHELWDRVGRMSHFPTQSSVLHNNAAYRAVLDNHVRMQLGARLPAHGDPWTTLIEVKDIAYLYELWAFLAVAEAVGKVLGPAVDRALVHHDELQQRVLWGTALRYKGGTTLTYNATFSPAGTPGRRSWSLSLRPDIVLEVARDDGAIERHLLDAKLKADWTASTTEDDADSGPNGSAKTADLQKMHTYLDAIDGTLSAWVVYPGHAFVFHGRDRTTITTVEDVPPCPNGIGAVPLAVGQASHDLEGLVARLLHRAPRAVSLTGGLPASRQRAPPPTPPVGGRGSAHGRITG